MKLPRMLSPTPYPSISDITSRIPFLTRPQLLIRFVPLPVGRDISRHSVSLRTTPRGAERLTYVHPLPQGRENGGALKAPFVSLVNSPSAALLPTCSP
jgi:hypothetical protein